MGTMGSRQGCGCSGSRCTRRDAGQQRGCGLRLGLQQGRAKNWVFPRLMPCQLCGWMFPLTLTSGNMQRLIV